MRFTPTWRADRELISFVLKSKGQLLLTERVTLLHPQYHILLKAKWNKALQPPRWVAFALSKGRSAHSRAEITEMTWTQQSFHIHIFTLATGNCSINVRLQPSPSCDLSMQTISIVNALYVDLIYGSQGYNNRTVKNLTFSQGLDPDLHQCVWLWLDINMLVTVRETAASSGNLLRHEGNM